MKWLGWGVYKNASAVSVFRPFPFWEQSNTLGLGLRPGRGKRTEFLKKHTHTALVAARHTPLNDAHGALDGRRLGVLVLELEPLAPPRKAQRGATAGKPHSLTPSIKDEAAEEHDKSHRGRPKSTTRGESISPKVKRISVFLISSMNRKFNYLSLIVTHLANKSAS